MRIFIVFLSYSKPIFRLFYGCETSDIIMAQEQRITTLKATIEDLEDFLD